MDLCGLGLDAAERRKLHALIDRRLQAQEQELAQAVEQALTIVPRWLRGPLRKALGL